VGFLLFVHSQSSLGGMNREVAVGLLPLMVAGWLLLFLPWAVSRRSVQKSYLWALPARSSQFSVEHGDEGALKEYSFGKEKYRHKVRVSGAG